MSNLTIILGLLSTITATIRQIESRSEIAVAAGEKVLTGEFKLALALSILEDVYNRTNPAVSFDQLKATITTTINTIVAVFNALGQFRTKATTAA